MVERKEWQQHHTQQRLAVDHDSDCGDEGSKIGKQDVRGERHSVVNGVSILGEPSQESAQRDVREPRHRSAHQR